MASASPEGFFGRKNRGRTNPSPVNPYNLPRQAVSPPLITCYHSQQVGAARDVPAPFVPASEKSCGRGGLQSGPGAELPISLCSRVISRHSAHKAGKPFTSTRPIRPGPIRPLLLPSPRFRKGRPAFLQRCRQSRRRFPPLRSAPAPRRRPLPPPEG